MEYKPYTIEELHQMVAEGEQEFAEGKWQDSDEMLYELRQERTNMDLTPYIRGVECSNRQSRKPNSSRAYFIY